jgi:ubiquinone/menaquinone biosynthesis C-methylase UbiE/DNA-binding MarR family transcriptional regulator
MESTAPVDSLVNWMASLADPKRLRILHLLEANELGVVELCDVLQLPQSTVSRHLKLLGDMGWLRSRGQGTTNLYCMILDELDPAARRLWLLARQQSAQSPAITQDQLRLQRRLNERNRDSQNFFAGAAGEWDKIRGELYGDKFSDIACLALLDANQVIADLGCGTAPIAAGLAPYVKQVIGVDDSPAMLRAAARRVAEFDNVLLHRGDLAAIPIDNAACDAAVIVLALTYVPDPPRVIGEMKRILRPGGKGVIVDLLPHDREDFRRQMGQRWMGLDLEQIQNWMREAGLKPQICRALPPEPKVKGPALFLAVGQNDSN